MTKFSKKKLLSTASMLAVVAAIPAGAMAEITVGSGKTVTGSDTLTDGAGFSVNNTTLTISGGVNLTDGADATVTTGAFTGATLVNNGTITGTAGQIAVDVDAANFSLDNRGTIDGTTGDLVDIAATSSGAFVNSGTLSTGTGAGIAIDLDAALTHANGIVNSGLIEAGSVTAVDLGASFVKLTNSGTIKLTASDGAADAAVDISATATGDITNTGTIASTLTGAGSAIIVDGALTGTIYNSGSMTAYAGVAVDINNNVTSLTNQSGGTIEAQTGNLSAVTVANNVTAGISNAGTIKANGTVDTIVLEGALIGDVTNTGTITNTSTGGAIDFVGALTGSFSNTGGTIQILGGGANAAVDFGSTISGSFTNTGTISTNGSAEGVIITGAVTGNFANTGGTITSSTGKAVDLVTTVGGTFSNTGLIQTTAGAEDALEVGGIITGAVSNTGTINSNGGIAIDLDAALTAGLTNNGTITAGGLTIDADANLTTLTNSGSNAVISSTGAATSAIDLASSTVSITNTSGGTITAVGTAATIEVAGAITGGIDNQASSTISNTGSGPAIGLTSTLSTNITNAGTISTVSTTAADAAIFSAAGGGVPTITNTGTIDAGVGGTALNFDASNDALTLNTSGLIKGAILLADTGAQIINITGGTVMTTENTAVITGNATARADTVTISGGASVIGIIDLGDDAGDSLNIGLASSDSFTTGGAINQVEDLNIDFGTFNVGHSIGVGGTALTTIAADSGTTTNINESVTFDAATVTSSGTLTVDAGKTLTINDAASADLTLASTSVTNIKITDENGAVGTATGLIAVQDAATVAGTLNLDVSGATGYIGTKNLSGIITATSGLNTAFTSYGVISGNGNTSPIFTLANNTSVAASANVTLTRTNTYNAVATDADDKAVGAALETIGAGDTGDAALRAILGNLDASTSAADLRGKLESLNPENSGANTQAVISAQNIALGTVETQLASYRGAEATGIATGNMFNEKAIWGQVFGSTADQDNREGVKGYQADTSGFALGADTSVTDKDRLGLSVTFATTEVDHERNGASSTDVDSFQIAAYGSHDEDKWYVDGLLGLAFNSYDQTRTLTVGTNRTALADYDGTQFTAKAKGGYKHSLNNGVNLTPTLSLQYTNTAVDSYTETGSDANLTVDSDDVNVFEAGLGIEAAYPITHGKAVFTPKVNAEYKYDFIGDEYESTNNFTSVTGTSFVSQGADVAQSTFVLGAGLDILAQDNVTVSFDYDGSYKEDYSSHSASLKARVEF